MYRSRLAMTAFAMLAQASRLVLLQGMTAPGGTQGIGLCRNTNLCVTNTLSVQTAASQRLFHGRVLRSVSPSQPHTRRPDVLTIAGSRWAGDSLLQAPA